MASLRAATAGLLLGSLLASCGATRAGLDRAALAGSGRLTLVPAEYAQLPGWTEDRLAPALAAFAKSCARLPAGSDGGPLDPAAREPAFGRLGDWRAVCRAAAAMPSGDERAARIFFEDNFAPALIGSGGSASGLFTGYWEVALDGSPTRQGPYQVPVYRRPPDLVADQPYLDRAAIEGGALVGRGLEVVWLTSADDLLVLQTQGSGQIRLPDGSTIRLVYEANNGRPTVNLGQLLLDRRLIPPAQFSDKAVRAWMRGNPEKAAALRRENPHYVFFRPLDGDGPVGAQGAVLTTERSLAVDRTYIPLGAPLWLDARDKYRPVAVRRLVVAQDTGDGISGPLRGDFYWGSGEAARARGSDFYAEGQYWALLPKPAAARLIAAAE